MDISGGMLAGAASRAEALRLCEGPRRLSLLQADATSLPFASASFDCVVDTFSLCVLDAAAGAALAEAARMLRPGGSVLLLEHSRSELPPLAAYQDATADAVAAGGKGCRWNQRVLELVAASGLRVISSQPALGGVLRSIVCVKDA